jgi:spore coat protein U-like protein
MFKKVACLAVIGAALASTGAHAAQQSATMAVSADITASCTLATNPLAFGSFTTTNTTPSLGNGRYLQTSAVVTCSSDSPFNVGIDYGANASGFQRRMFNGTTGYMNYEVYVDGFGVNAFGTVSNYGTANNYNSPLTGNDVGPNTVPIYGVIPQQSTPASGTYTDTLTVTVNY